MGQLQMIRPDLKDLPDIPEMDAGFFVRPAGLADLDGLAQLLQEAFNDKTWTCSRVNSSLLNAVDVVKTFVVEREGEIAATASARLDGSKSPPAGYVHWVGAKGQYRGKHFGYILSLAVLHELRSLELNAAFLDTDDERIPAIKTYLRLGFVPLSREYSQSQRWRQVYTQIFGDAEAGPEPIREIL